MEVAKFFTIIDPRKPLLEAVNVQFDSGVISRVLVSSPWMPPVCGFCKEIGHSTKRCLTAPKPCPLCNSTDHAKAKCPQAPKQVPRGMKTRRSKSRDKQKWKVVDNQLVVSQAAVPSQLEQPANNHPQQSVQTDMTMVEINHQSKLGTVKDKAKGESSGTAPYLRSVIPRSASGTSRSSQSDVQPDSSDVESSDSELEECEFSKHEPDFEVVRNRKRFSGQKGKRDRGPKLF